MRHHGSVGSRRTWTILGTLGCAGGSMVDQAGSVVPFGQCWSLDWWIGADDRWHLPSHEAAVRQRLVSGVPVVETAMRVPGGDAIHRTYGVRGRRGEDLIAVEIENRSRLPFAVALAIRPTEAAGNDIQGYGGIKRIDHHDRRVTVDGRASLVLPAPPRLTVAATGADRDLARTVESGAASARPLGSVRDPGGLAQAAFLFPLAHGAMLTVVIVDDPAETNVLPVPSPADVTRAWHAQTRRGMRLDLPEGALADAIDANRRFVYLFQDDVVALDRYGFHDDAGRILAGRQLDDGAALWALAEHWRLTGDDELVRALAPAIVGAGRRIERRRHKLWPQSDPESHGLLPSSYRANFWALRGLLDGAQLLAAVGEERAASAVAGSAAGLKRDLDASLGLAALRLDSRAIPSGPHRPLDADCVDALVAWTPLHLYEATDPAITATLEAANEHYRVGAQGSAVRAEHALLLAAADLERGDRRALAWLSRLVDQASPTWTWPLASGCGHDGRAAAGFCSLVRDLMVRDVPDGVAICTLLPQQWWGRSIEVHDAPTHAGVLSFAVRWHQDRPALLWELRRRHPNEQIRLTAPGLDADWHSEQPAGDALLSPPAPFTRGDTGREETGFG